MIILRSPKVADRSERMTVRKQKITGDRTTGALAEMPEHVPPRRGMKSYKPEEVFQTPQRQVDDEPGELPSRTTPHG